MCGVFPSQSAFMNRCNASRRRWSHRPFLNHTKLTTLLTWTLRGLLTPLMKCTLTSSHTWVKLQRCPFNPSSSQTNPPQHSTFCGHASPPTPCISSRCCYCLHVTTLLADKRSTSIMQPVRSCEASKRLQVAGSKLCRSSAATARFAITNMIVRCCSLRISVSWLSLNECE